MSNFSSNSSDNNARKQYKIGGQRKNIVRTLPLEPVYIGESVPTIEESLDSISYSLSSISEALNKIAGIDND